MDVYSRTQTHAHTDPDSHVWDRIRIFSTYSHTHMHIINPLRRFVLLAYSQNDGCVRTHARTYTHRPRQTCVGQDINLRLNIPLEKDYPEAKLRKSVVAFVPTSPGTTGTNINRYKHKSPPPYFSAWRGLLRSKTWKKYCYFCTSGVPMVSRID